jgi:predicted 3-demethylubiquinone-9 3-methyltransferase (glyoxalase superfamily)
MHEPIYPCLWFDTQAREAAEYYCTIFPDSRIISNNPVVTIFELRGKRFMALNGGPLFMFNESVSFVIDCKDQAEVDHYWDSLTADGGKESQCGWLKDKYGLSWQVVPAVLGQLMNDPVKGGKVMQALLKMKKLVIAELQAAGE